MTRIKIGNHAQKHTDGFWFDFFDNWRLATLFESVEQELTEAQYYAKLHSELEKIGAVYINDKVGCYLDFARDEDATMFVLRWS